MTIIKKIKVLSAMLVLTIAVILPLSCTDVANVEKEQIEFPSLTMAEIHELGIKHNEALGEVLVGFNQNEVSQLQDLSEIQSAINSELNSYYRNAFDKKLKVEPAIKYSSESVKEYFQRANDSSYKKKNSENLSPIEMTINEHKDYLSEAQIRLLEKLNKVLSHAASDVNNAISKLDEIQTVATKNLSANEAQVILIGAEIGKASLVYWNKNLDDWQKVLNTSQKNKQIKAKGWFSWSDLAGADVAGAVGGAVGAAVVNAIPVAGQVGYAGAIIGGAAGGSAASAVTQVWDHIF